MQQPKLTIELVPNTSWYRNVRSAVDPMQWDALRKHSYKKANHRCEICNGKGKKHPVECHEIWEYDDQKNTQTLTGLTSLCPSCHEVKHIGLALKRGRIEEAAAHLAKINNWDYEQTSDYVMQSFAAHEARNQRQWTVDLSILGDLIREASRS